MKKAAFSVLIASIFLSGCIFIPDYTRPNLPAPRNWPGEKVAFAANEKAVTSITWKEFFKSPALQRVIQIALENNRDLRVAALNAEAARELYRVQWANLLPEINVGTRGSLQWITKAQSRSSAVGVGVRGGRSFTQYTANIASTAFELDLFGRIRSQNKAALEEYFATEEAKDAVQLSLIAATANTYLQWLTDRKLLKLTQQTLITQEKSYALIAKRHKNGVASKLDLAQVRTAVEAVRADYALFTRQVAQDKNALVLLMGVDNYEVLTGAKTLDDMRLIDNLPVGLPSHVLLLRPDIRQAEHQLKAANANIGAARAAFFPTLSLTETYGYASRDLLTLFSSGAAGAWSFIPQITMPIFQGGRNLANLNYSKVNKEIAIAQYEKAIQIAFREVADQLAAYKTLDDQLSAQRNLVQAAQDYYNLSYARYKYGVASFLNVLDAQRSLFAAQQNMIKIRKQQLSNLVNLYKVLGGGTEV